MSSDAVAPVVRSPLPPLHYPPARRDDSVVEDYHGVRISDPYCWLEDPDSEETKEFVDKQSTLTDSVLAVCDVMDKLRQQITVSYDHPRYDTPFKRRNRYFYFHDSGLQAQSVIYVQIFQSTRKQDQIEPKIKINCKSQSILTAENSKDKSQSTQQIFKDPIQQEFFSTVKIPKLSKGQILNSN